MEKDNDFVIGLIAPGVAKAECRNGKYLDYIRYAKTDAEALIDCFGWAEMCVSGRVASREQVMKNIMGETEWNRMT